MEEPHSCKGEAKIVAHQISNGTDIESRLLNLVDSMYIIYILRYTLYMHVSPSAREGHEEAVRLREYK